MKKIILISVITLILSSFFTESIAQQASNYLFVFNKENGKVFKQIDKRTKSVDFNITGIKNQSDITTIQDQFRSSKQVISFIINNDILNGSSKAKLVCLKTFKVEDFKTIAKSLNVKEISLDGSLIAVDDLKQKSTPQPSKTKASGL